MDFRNTYHIEKSFMDGTRIIVKWSDCVESGSIKILRTGAPNLKWKFEERTQANIDFEFIKKFVQEFLFKNYFDKDETLAFMEKNLREEVKK